MQKKYYQYDTHAHTSETSRCGRATAAEMITRYAELGYTGVIITDHFNGNTLVPRNLPWDERINLFYKGYEQAVKAAKKYKLTVFSGWEYYMEGNDFLTYGLTKEWLLDHPHLLELDLNDYLKLVRADGGLVVHAHPFRQASYIKMIRLLPDLVDAVEIANGQRLEIENLRARWYAESYNLPATAGSDAHHPDCIRSCGILSEEKFTCVEDYMQAVLERRIHVLFKSHPA